MVNSCYSGDTMLRSSRQEYINLFMDTIQPVDRYHDKYDFEEIMKQNIALKKQHYQFSSLYFYTKMRNGTYFNLSLDTDKVIWQWNQCVPGAAISICYIAHNDDKDSLRWVLSDYQSSRL